MGTKLVIVLFMTSPFLRLYLLHNLDNLLE